MATGVSCCMRLYTHAHMDLYGDVGLRGFRGIQGLQAGALGEGRNVHRYEVECLILHVRVYTTVVFERFIKNANIRHGKSSKVAKASLQTSFFRKRLRFKKKVSGGLETPISLGFLIFSIGF